MFPCTGIFPNANITWGIENVRVVVHMALAFWGCWGNMSLEMPTYEYKDHIHSRALVDNLTHYHVGSLGTMILSDKVSMLFTFRAFLFGHVSNVWLMAPRSLVVNPLMRARVDQTGFAALHHKSQIQERCVHNTAPCLRRVQNIARNREICFISLYCVQLIFKSQIRERLTS